MCFSYHRDGGIPSHKSGLCSDVDDDDLLSSGQVSPIGVYRFFDSGTKGLVLSLCIDHQPNSFNILHDGRSLETSLAHANAERDRKVLEFDQKRPWGNRIYQSRITSWADPISARDILDGEGGEVGADVKKKEMKPTTTAERSLVEEDEDSGELAGDWSDGIRDTPRRTLAYGSQRCVSLPDLENCISHGTFSRRRSFHDLSSLRDMRVLKIEQMRVDVELCGQLLIMARREEHLQNVMACLEASICYPHFFVKGLTVICHRSSRPLCLTQMLSSDKTTKNTSASSPISTSTPK